MENGNKYRGRLQNNDCVEVSIENGKIESVEKISDQDGLPYILPVLVDLQQNGALGHSFDYVHEYGKEGIDKVADFLRMHGVGRCMPTTNTSPVDELVKSMSSLDEILKNNEDLSALFFNFFFEGVYISPEDGWRGAHAKQWVRQPDYKEFKEIDAASGNRFKTISMAPEAEGGLDFIEEAVNDEKIVSMGHCHPTAEIIAEAVARGATLVTHFGNGAVPMIHRHKNPFWAYLNHPELKLGLICDGFHLPKDLVGTALKCKGLENCWPVSDASSKSGMKPGKYDRKDGDAMVIEDNGFVHLDNSELLAGAWFQQDRCVDFLVKNCEMNFLDAWKQCSEVPAAIIGIELPKIAAGEEASFVLAKWDDGLVIEQSVHLGKAYLDKPVTPLTV